MQSVTIYSQRESGLKARMMLALSDIKEGAKKWRIWLLLAWQDIRLRYRRSFLGPFWITLSMAITIGMTGMLYGVLLNFRMAEYFPYFASGMLIWNLISILIMEGSNIFAESEHFLKQMKLPYSVFVYRFVARNFIIFLHNIVIFIPIMFLFHIKPTFYTLLVFPGLFLIIWNAIALGFILAIFGTRFRDITQVVNSLIQVIFFLTPIIWVPNMLPAKFQFAVKLNPIAQFLEMVRNPLLGLAPSFHAIWVTLTLSILSAVFAFIFFMRFRARISYWL